MANLGQLNEWDIARITMQYLSHDVNVCSHTYSIILMVIVFFSSFYIEWAVSSNGDLLS